MSLCLCGSGLKTEACCGPILDGNKSAPTAEALLRARYTAYGIGNIDYIEKTCAPEALKEFNRLDVEQFSEKAEWTGLEIKKITGGGEADQQGEIEFVFSCLYDEKPFEQCEIAQFVRKDGAWFYKSSEVNPHNTPHRVVQIGRNDPCTCGSGKKYKKCCGN